MGGAAPQAEGAAAGGAQAEEGDGSEEAEEEQHSSSEGAGAPAAAAAAASDAAADDKKRVREAAAARRCAAPLLGWLSRAREALRPDLPRGRRLQLLAARAFRARRLEQEAYVAAYVDEACAARVSARDSSSAAGYVHVAQVQAMLAAGPRAGLQHEPSSTSAELRLQSISAICSASPFSSNRVNPQADAEALLEALPAAAARLKADAQQQAPSAAQPAAAPRSLLGGFVPGDWRGWRGLAAGAPGGSGAELLLDEALDTQKQLPKLLAPLDPW